MVEASMKDSKIVQTLTWLEEGKTKEEIAILFGHKSWKSIDMYFRRRGFKWNGTTYYIPKKRAGHIPSPNKKTAKIIHQLGEDYANIEDISIKNGFLTVEELGRYMKNEGYVWDSIESAYHYDKVVKREKVIALSPPIQSALTTHSFTHGLSEQNVIENALEIFFKQPERSVMSKKGD